MAGLIAVIAPGKAAPLLLDKVLNAAPGRPEPVRRFEHGVCAIALFLPNNIAPTVWQTGPDWCNAVHGEVANRDAAVDLLSAPLPSGSAARLSAMGGLYHLACWNGATDMLTIGTDSLGALPLFEAQVEGAHVFSSAPGPLLAWRRHDPLDRTALHALLSFGYQTGNRTLRTTVHTTPPASVATICHRRGAFTVEHHAGAGLRPPGGDLGATLRRAVRRTAGTDARITLGLTGGVDSSGLLCAFKAEGLTLGTVTVAAGQRGDPDAARRNAASLGVAHMAKPMAERITDADLNALRNAISSTSDWHFAALRPMFDAAKEETLALGFLGGTFAGAFRDMEDRLGDAIAPHAHCKYDRPLARPQIDAPEAATHRDLGPVQRLNLLVRQQRYTSGMIRLGWQSGRIACPFSHDDVVAAARAMPSPGARRHALRQAFREFGQLLNGNDGLPMHSVLRRGLHARLRGTIVASLVRSVIPEFPGGYRADRLQPVADALVRQLSPARQAVLQRHARSTFAQFALVPLLLDEPDEVIDAIGEILA